MLGIVGLIVILVATYYVYKTARDNGRNAVIWGLITFGVGFGIQIILPLIIGIIIAVVWMTTGSTAAEMQRNIQVPGIAIGIVCIILSFIAIGLIMRLVAKIPEEKSFVSPPSPPEF